ncbi:MAG: asparagine synthase (glutamine-hydrolyzing) [Candidatus Omnitrophica bacterium]|nr:asparagine synthase (glutamine-hydrolyzing) [Candidatus Omnitrophota bacterium]
MCGIAGIIHHSGIHQDDIDLIARMNELQKHRGPDDEGIYSDKHCCLGHRRLSIIDLSINGHQPFYSDDGRLILTFNGEIYNYIELRDELESLGWIFKTKTDTEVLLKAYQQFGKDCLTKFNGMFAFAVYDTKTHSLFLARDRVGIKPLYYVIADHKLYFASEIKALRVIPGINCSVNHQSLFDYLVFNRTDVYDETFVNDIKRLPKGHWGEFSHHGLKIESWWDAGSFLDLRGENNLEAIIAGIEQRLVSAVDLRMRSDVPVGSCLSGGLDSSILTGILFRNKLAGTDYPTFTVSFPGHRVDETQYVEALNQQYPFKNHRAYPTGKMAHDGLKEFVYTNDEPTTGPSFYSQYALMRAIRENGVTVLLDGQGGDESFGGYQYFHGFYLNGLFWKQKYLKFLHNLFKIILRGQDKTAYQTLAFQLLPDAQRKQLLFKYHPYIDPDFFYTHIQTSRIYNEFFDAPDLNGSLVRHFRYKLEHLLRMEDRNSMAFSIEARLPYLDYRLIEYILNVSEDLKIKAGETKYLQKMALGQYSIPEIVNRKDKIGFGTPQEWLDEEPWKKETANSARYCEEAFSTVFKKDFLRKMPKNGTNRWKINQLAVWHELLP